MKRLRWIAPAALAAVVVACAAAAASGPDTHRPPAAKPGSAQGPKPHTRVLFYSSDGMRPDLMERYAAAGAMPTYKELMDKGVRGANGDLPAFPPNTGVGWYTMATGAWPSEFGSTNNTFHRTGDGFDKRTSFSSPVVLQADTILAAAERRKLKVAAVEWVGSKNFGVNGPVVDFASFFSKSTVLVAKSDPTEKAGADAFGFTISYQVAAFVPADGWTSAPAGDPAAPPRQATLNIPSTSTDNPSRDFDLYVYDSVVDAKAAYDTVILVPRSAAKDASKAVATLKVGDFKGVRLNGADALIGSRAGQAAGFNAKLIALSPDLSTFKLYTTTIARPAATCHIAACDALPAGAPGEDRLEKYIAENMPPWTAADFAPLEARVIDEETYVQQGRELEKAYADAVLEYVLGKLQPDTDLAMVGYPVTDEFSHQFMGLVTPTDMDGAPNPYYDDVEGDGVRDKRLEVREGYLRSAYAEADAKLAAARKLLGGNPTTFASSDHGFAPQWYAVNGRKVLFDAQVKGTSLQASGGNTASNCGADKTDLAKACWAGGTIQIYVNTTLPAGITYEDVRSAAFDAFKSLRDPANPSKQVVSAVFRKEDLRNVDGVDALHPNRSGDVVVALRPPYQSDAGTPGKAIAFSQFFGQHGYLPNLVDIPHNVDMHSTFVAGGPGILHLTTPVAGVRAIDIAPTIAFLLGIPGPQNARGKILYPLVYTNPKAIREITILDISDYHGQLIPLSETSDTVGPSFGTGGAAFLKSWFDVYRAEVRDGSITIAGGDSEGATPPISSFFGDKPTVELMNLMGFDADGLGNHNFDRGADYLRGTLIPLAKYRFLSSNVVDAQGRTPKEWAKSKVFTRGGVKIGLIGFSNQDIPELTKPGSLGPFKVVDAKESVAAEASRLRRAGVRTVIAFGHLGATLGTLTAPQGPLLDLATEVGAKVDVVVGDHTDFQVLAVGKHYVLITENRSKGLRFTRIRLVIDPRTGRVIYRTADFHKPWNIGMAASPPLQTKIDDLNAQLAPILSTLVGNSTTPVPRSDACGNSAGRTCESKEGDVVTDAMRSTYVTDFAITNSGGLRADLTCPTTDNPSDFCPAYTPPPYPITRGQVLGVLPFGNVVVTLQVTGAELKAMLENGVSTMPAVGGRFPQVSGLCFTYDIGAPVGSRVVAAVRANPDGTCGATAIDLTAAATYSLAENDFMASGGDGYPVLAPKATSRDLMDQVTADYIKAKGTISPSIQGRVKCVGPACPVVTQP